MNIYIYIIYICSNYLEETHIPRMLNTLNMAFLWLDVHSRGWLSRMERSEKRVIQAS